MPCRQFNRITTKCQAGKYGASANGDDQSQCHLTIAYQPIALVVRRYVREVHNRSARFRCQYKRIVLPRVRAASCEVYRVGSCLELTESASGKCFASLLTRRRAKIAGDERGPRNRVEGVTYEAAGGKRGSTAKRRKEQQAYET